MTRRPRPAERARRNAGWILRGRRDLVRTYALVERSGLFDAAYYLETNPDVAASAVDPLRHYVEHGSHEGRRPAEDVPAGFERVLAHPPSPLLPPPELRESLEPFELIGRLFLDHFVTLAHLRPGDAVLDVGCGMGRMAIPLTGYLRPPGRYEGFDVELEAVEWCQRTVTPLHPSFRFRHVDLHNGAYNRPGHESAAEFTFPYPDASFDFVFLTSVFTHLLREDMEHYVEEIHRVLRPGGRLFVTYFLVDEETRRPAPGRHFVFDQDLGGGAYAVNAQAPEATLAYDRDYALAVLERAGLHVEAVHPGSWSGRENTVEFQDVVIGRRAT